MKQVFIALLLCAVGGCTSRPIVVDPMVMTCDSGSQERKFLTPAISLQVFSTSVASPERQRVRNDMIALVRAGQLQSALALGEAQLALTEAELKAGRGNEVELAGLITEVSQLQQALQRIGPAEAGYLRAISLYTSVQHAYPEMLRPTLDLAILYRSQGKPALALPLQLDAYPKLLAWLGPEHPDVIESEGELLQLRLKLKQYDAAEVLLRARLDRAKLAGDKVAISTNRKALANIRRARTVKRI